MQRIDGVMLPTVTDEAILGFFGPYRFLSNFHLCNVTVDGVRYQSSEHAFMAQKTDVPEERHQLSAEIGLTPKEAKQYGRTVTLRPGWDDLRVEAMRKVVLAKFSQNPALRKALLDTGEKYLEETNYWNDTFWGMCRGTGENNLGKVLMSVRGELMAILS